LRLISEKRPLISCSRLQNLWQLRALFLIDFEIKCERSAKKRTIHSELTPFFV
jgi:hypothetical protein